MCVAVVLAEDGGCVNVATKVVQGKVKKEQKSAPDSAYKQEGGSRRATRRVRCDRSYR